MKHNPHGFLYKLMTFRTY